jgi:large subunit ribosomal protein LP0
MSGGERKKATNAKVRKQNLFARINSLLTEYDKILIVSANNVGSNHLQKIRVSLRAAGATLFVGKNTMIRKAIKSLIPTRPQLEALLPAIRGNVGLIFTKGDIGQLKKLTDENKVESVARVGAIANAEVIVPAGVTGLEPTKTSFFQALQIATKINKGLVEIINDVKLISVGQKVGQSEAALLQMLNIRPFKYGLQAVNVYDAGSLFEASVLDISPEDILSKFREGVQKVAAVSLAVNHPTIASVPHSIIKGYKNVLSVAVATNLTFKQAAPVKAYLANPTAFAKPAAKEEKEEKKEEKKDDKKKDDKKKEEPKKDDKKKEEPKKEEKKKEEKKEEEEEDMGLGLFD